MPQTKIKLSMEKVEGKPLAFADQKMFDDFDNQLPPGHYEGEITRPVKSKTDKQLGAHFGLMILSAIEQANDIGLDTSAFLKEMVKTDLPSGIGLTKDFLKTIFYVLCPMYRAGKRITLSKANTLEASKHFSDCCKLLATHGIYIDEPNPNWKNE